jgi:hypothetical protein
MGTTKEGTRGQARGRRRRKGDFELDRVRLIETDWLPKGDTVSDAATALQDGELALTREEQGALTNNQGKVNAGTPSPASAASEDSWAVAKRIEFVRLAAVNNISITRDMRAVFEALLDLEDGSSHCAGKQASAVQTPKSRRLKAARSDLASRKLSR